MVILNLKQSDFEPHNGQDVCLAFGNQPKHWKLPRTIMANLTMINDNRVDRYYDYDYCFS